MKIKLANHYWSGKYSVGVEADTPLGISPVNLVIYELITKDQFDGYINSFQNPNYKDCFNIIEEDDGQNKTYHITETYKR